MYELNVVCYVVVESEISLVFWLLEILGFQGGMRNRRLNGDGVDFVFIFEVFKQVLPSSSPV